MISFEFYDYIVLCLSAFVFGAVFSLFECICETAFKLFRVSCQGVYSAFVYTEKPFKFKINTTGIDKKTFDGDFFVASRTVLFSIGFILMSFAVMDGEVRIFAFLISLIAFIAVSSYLSPFISRFFFGFSCKLIEFSVIAFRLVTYPLRCIILLFVSYFSIICKRFMQNKSSL